MTLTVVLVLMLSIVSVFVSCDKDDDDDNNDNNTGATFTDPRDGNKYTTVSVGTQIWMGENMNYFTSTGSWFYNDDSAAYSSIYGRLYNWETAKSACPSGWHLPTDDEWKILETNFGMSADVLDNSGWRPAPKAGLLRTGSFRAKNGGTKYENGDYTGMGYNAFFWTSTEYSSSVAYYRSLQSSDTLILRSLGSMLSGNSVRCVKD